MDDIENQQFHFDINLERKPNKISSEIEVGYLGRHTPLFMLPSYIKLFEYRQLSQIWKSAIVRISETEELVIIGYSFRPEDSNSVLLISSLPNDSIIKIVDPNSEDIIMRLKNLGFDNNMISYKSLEEYISSSN